MSKLVKITLSIIMLNIFTSASAENIDDSSCLKFVETYMKGLQFGEQQRQKHSLPQSEQKIGLSHSEIGSLLKTKTNCEVYHLINKALYK